MLPYWHGKRLTSSQQAKRMSKPWRERTLPLLAPMDLTSNQQLANEPHIRHWLAYTQCYPFKEQPCAPRAVYEPRSSAATPATAPATPTTPLPAARASAYVNTLESESDPTNARAKSPRESRRLIDERIDWVFRCDHRRAGRFLRSQLCHLGRQGALLHASDYEHLQQIRQYLGGPQQCTHRDD
jgi:hypothetical protein